MKKFIKNKKICIMIFVCIILVIYIGRYTGVLLSLSSKHNKIKEDILVGDYIAAEKKCLRYKKFCLKKNDKIRLEIYYDLCELARLTGEKDIDKINNENEDNKNNNKFSTVDLISNISIKYTINNYLNIFIQNNNKIDIKYIKIRLFFYNNNEIIKIQYVNYNNILQPKKSDIILYKDIPINTDKIELKVVDIEK